MQQNGATPHTAGEPMAWLQEHFPRRLINLKGCAPHFSNLSPLHVFSGATSIIDFTRGSHEQQKQALNTTITAEAARPPSEMFHRTVGHLQTVRLPELIRRTVAHIEHLP